jgi:hypothetical protein
MSKPRILQHPEAIHLVKNRCIEGKAFFQPCGRVRTIIERTLAWSADIHNVIVYGYNFELNQFEMVIQAPRLNRQDFMRDFQSVIAREIKKVIGRTEKGFFAGTYENEPILDAECVAREVARMLCAPCDAGLVDHPSKWPGVSSWALHGTCSTLVREREDRSVFHRLKQEHPEMSDAEASKRATSTHELRLAEPQTAGAFGELSVIRRLVSTRLEQDNPESTDYLGVARVRSWPADTPVPQCEYRPARLCVTTSPTRRRRFSELRRDANLYYDWARKRLRLGASNPRFPYGMIPLHQSQAVGASRAAAARDPTRRGLDAFWRSPP